MRLQNILLTALIHTKLAQTITDTMSTSNTISVTMNIIFSIIIFVLFVTFVHINGQNYKLYIYIYNCFILQEFLVVIKYIKMKIKNIHRYQIKEIWNFIFTTTDT
jgi:hypothetical protein